jgi:predicted ribosome quality control (RQC) complex YloA/Tae2 family protein
MKTYESLDGIILRVGENAKENDQLTMNSCSNEWWMHVSEYPGSHVIICYEDVMVPKETKRDAAVLAVYHSKASPQKMTKVDFVRVDQISKYENSYHGEVLIEGSVTQLTVFMNKEKPRLDRLLKNRNDNHLWKSCHSC